MRPRHYLRAYLFGANGKLLPSLMKNTKVSTALLPVMKLPGMKRYADAVADACDKDRRAAAVDVLVEGQKQRKVIVYGVALVSCPNRQEAEGIQKQGQGANEACAPSRSRQ